MVKKKGQGPETDVAIGADEGLKHKSVNLGSRTRKMMFLFPSRLFHLQFWQTQNSYGRHGVVTTHRRTYSDGRSMATFVKIKSSFHYEPGESQSDRHV